MTYKDAQIEALYPPEGDFLEVDGWRVHHVTRGQGPHVLLLHGAGGSTRDMTFRVLPDLEGAGFRLTAIDRPGHGYTTGRFEDLAVTPLEQARVCWRICDSLGIDRPIVLGQSFGGSVALAMELCRPGGTAGLCLVSAAVTDDLPTGAQGMEMLMRLDMIRGTTLAAISSERFLETAMGRLFQPESVPEGYSQHFGPGMTMREKPFRHYMRQVSELGACLARMMPHYDTIEAPVELLHGSADTILDFDAHAGWLARQIPQARLTCLPGAGHMPHQTHTEHVLHAVIRIASGRGGRRGVTPASA